MDSLNWNLDKIYKSFDSDDFKKDIEQLKLLSNDMYLSLKENSKNITETAEKYITLSNTFGSLLSRLSEYCLLTLSENSNNSTAAKYLDIVNDIESDTAKSDALFCHIISSLTNIDEIINSSEILKSHRFFIKEIYLKASHSLSEKEETIYSKMQNTGSTQWEKLWENITSSLICTVETKNGTENLPLSETRNLAYSAHAETRKNAYFSELKALESISSQSAFALNAIKGEVINISEIRNYSSPLDMTLVDSRMDSAVFNSMLSAVKKCVPYFKNYFRKKSELLGKASLPFYDMFAPVVNNSKVYTYAEAMDIILEGFYSFSSDLGDFAQNAFENNWIDVLPKKGKTGGAFCSHIHAIGESRILTNFTGSFSDVVTIAHELGHGFHGEMLKNETYLNSDYPMPIAETASTFCECIIKNALLKTAASKEKLLISENDLSDSAQIIVDILSRFIFEDTVFKLRKEGSLSSDELCDIMLSAQKQTYGDGLSLYHPYMWVCKPHYYDAQYNYYNFPYAFGLLLAKGLYRMYINDKSDFIPKYRKLLSLTGKASIKDTALSVGIDLSDEHFWNMSVEEIKSDIEKFMKIGD